MQKSCVKCKEMYEIADEDLAFLDRISPVIAGKKQQIPPPTHCPNCRKQRRLIWRNERFLYHRKCDKCGKQMISMYSPDKNNKVYCLTCWWGDGWNPLDCGMEFDFNKTFAEQFRELSEKAPMVSLISDLEAENNNCSFVNFAGNNKNCYMIFDSDFNEDCYFSCVIKNSKNCIDCSYLQSGELCYETVSCANCYNVNFSEDSSNCMDSYFLKNCRGCSNCFMCSNLVQQKYHIYNKPVSKEEYEKFILELGINKNSVLINLKKKFKEYILKFPHKETHNLKVENCTGDYITNSKNCEHSYHIGECEKLKYCDALYRAYDCYDVSSFGEKIERVYESSTIGLASYDILFSNVSTAGNLATYYCLNVRTIKNCFGCISARRNEYCILNKQHEKSEYEAMVTRIIEHMRKTGEWGEFFPAKISPFTYNECVANQYYPLDEKGAKKLGMEWKELSNPGVLQGVKIFVPDDLTGATSEIIKQIFTCKKCDKNYKIIEQELGYYKKKGLPLPENCFNCRTEERFTKLNPQKLFSRACAKCYAKIQTTFAPDRPETIYCEKCYLESVY